MRSAARVLLGLLGIAACVVAAAGCESCSGSNANRLAKLADALEKDDAAEVKSAVSGLPECADAEPVALAPGQPSPRDTECLARIATALGSKKGFNPSPPDQAAAATAAVLLVRDGRGDWIAHVDNWLGSMKNGKGPGADALRLAVAKKMAEVAPRVGRKIEDDATAIDTLKAITAAIPGACPTYALLAAGRDPAKLSPELSSEHAACVHKDLARREGPGSSYGAGIMRALEGALAEWREAERALRLGLANVGPGAKATLEGKLKIIEPATQAIATKKIDATAPQATLTFLGEVHADAGIVLWKDAGGPDAAVDAAPTPRPLRMPLPAPSK